MPDVSWAGCGQAQPVFAQESAVPAASAKADDSRKLIAMYVTHSDESYVPPTERRASTGRAAYTTWRANSAMRFSSRAST